MQRYQSILRTTTAIRSFKARKVSSREFFSGVELSAGLKLLQSSALLGTKVFGTVGVGLGIALYVYQDRLLYFPNPAGAPPTPDHNPPGFINPGEYDVRGIVITKSKSSQPIPYTEEFVTTSDGKKLHTWLLLQPEVNTSTDGDSRQYPTLIYFHGNAGNMGFRLPHAATIYATTKMNILMMDYRGYGKSTGTPNEKGLQLDAQTVLNYVVTHPKLKQSPVIFFGSSLGGAVALDLAARSLSSAAIHGVIVENTFLSISAMIDIVMPFLSWAKTFFLTNHWESVHKITRITPILFISGDADELIPVSHMQKLHDLATQAKYREWYSVAGGGHNDTSVYGGQGYYQRIHKFVQEHVTPASRNSESDSK